jgi:hypothetical protein
MNSSPPKQVSLPDLVWVTHILPRCDPPALSTMAKTKRIFRSESEEIRRGKTHGLKLALGGVRALVDKLAVAHYRCSQNAHKAATAADSYVAMLCAALRQPEKVLPMELQCADKRRAHLEGLAKGRSSSEVLKTYSKKELAALIFYLLLLPEVTWLTARHALRWALETLELPRLLEVVRGNCDRLVLKGKTDRENVILSAVGKIWNANSPKDANAGYDRVIKLSLAHLRTAKNMDFALAALVVGDPGYNLSNDYVSRLKRLRSAARKGYYSVSGLEKAIADSHLKALNVITSDLMALFDDPIRQFSCMGGHEFVSKTAFLYWKDHLLIHLLYHSAGFPRGENE